MLTVHPINNIKYYVEDDYYLNDDAPRGEWTGKGSICLGLSNKTIGDEYHHIMKGLSPNGKEPLCAQLGDNHRAGWDLTFSAPKSVSIVWALSDEVLRKKISDAQLTAVKQAISLLEDNAAYTRRGEGGTIREQVPGFVVAPFEHETSRALDCALHTHALVANIAPRKDGTFGTIISKDLYFWQKAAGATYRAELAYQMKNLGLTVEPDNESFRLSCIPEEINQHFSKRTEAIKERLNETSVSSSASKVGNSIKVTSRQAKQKVDRSKLIEKWQGELNSFGLTNAYLEENRSSSKKINPLPEVDDMFALLTEKVAVFRRQDVFQLIATQLQWLSLSANNIKGLAHTLFADNEIVKLGVDEKNNAIFSTRQMIRIETELLEYATSLSKKEAYRLTQEGINRAINFREKYCGYSLSSEQKSALINVCCEGDFSILQGSAGSGKSSAMSVLNSAYTDNGYSVIGAAIAKKAADNLAEESGIPSFTVAKLITDSQNRRNHFSNADVLVIDEAGQLGTKQLHELLRLANEHSVKVILVGEDKQLNAIEHPGCLFWLSQKLGCSRIEKIQRQRDPDSRTAVAQLRDGKATQAMKTFKQKGLLHFEDSSDDTKNLMVETWNKYRSDNPNKASILLAQRWKDVNQLSERMRTVLQAEGTVSKEEVELDCIVSQHHCKYKFAEGDRVKFCKNDYRLGVSNGTMGTIKKLMISGADVKFLILTDDGRLVAISKNSYQSENGRLPLALGYALTVYASQGTTIDGNVYVYWTSGMDRANSYVAGSRHKDDCHWFFNKKEISLLESSNPNQNVNDGLINTVDVISKIMSTCRSKAMALEYLKESTLQQGRVLNSTVTIDPV
jgi:conjugative relaxase-like TrwC/TraI family protein